MLRDMQHDKIVERKSKSLTGVKSNLNSAQMCLKQLDFITTRQRSSDGNKNTVGQAHGAGSRAQWEV